MSSVPERSVHFKETTRYRGDILFGFGNENRYAHRLALGHCKQCRKNARIQCVCILGSQTYPCFHLDVRHNTTLLALISMYPMQSYIGQSHRVLGNH